jgi:hypothetical protein
VKENRPNGFEYANSTAARTTVLEKFGEKGSQGCLLDGSIDLAASYQIAVQD